MNGKLTVCLLLGIFASFFTLVRADQLPSNEKDPSCQEKPVTITWTPTPDNRRYLNHPDDDTEGDDHDWQTQCAKPAHLCGEYRDKDSGFYHIAHPWHRHFPCAQMPYGQAPDQCSGINDPDKMPDHWGPVNFTDACDNHDRCYYSPDNPGHVHCNQRFFQDLEHACEKGLSYEVQQCVKIFGRKICTPPVTIPGRLNPVYPYCLKLAGTMSAAVAASAPYFYPKAQECTRNYTTMYKTYVRDVFEWQKKIAKLEQWQNYCRKPSKNLSGGCFNVLREGRTMMVCY